MAYIDWWNRTGPITMGERFGLNEISTRAKTLSPTKSYTEGGRTGFDAGTLVAEEISVKPNKAWELAKKYVGTPVTKVIAGATLPGTQIIPETVKAIKEKRLPDYDLTDPNTWMQAAFWNWAVKEWGVTKTLDQFSKANIPGKAKILSHVVARGGLSPKLVKFISSKVAWPATAAASVYDAYKDYQRRKPFIEEQKELIEQGVVKEEEFDKEAPMFATGGIASLIK